MCGKLRTLQVDENADPSIIGDDTTCFNTRCGSMSLELLTHHRFAHVPIPKLAQMSNQVNGLPRALHFPQLLRLPCNLCNVAKAVKQPFPDASKNEPENEDDLMTWDLVDMGEKWKTVGGNRYISIFCVKKSRYGIAILHKDRKNFEGILNRAITKCGFVFKRIRCDGAGEYICDRLSDYFKSRDIEVQYSNPREQFQNGISEKMVDTMGRMMRTVLLQSHLPPEFWGCAIHYCMDVYNHIPHSSLNGRIPYAVHHGQRPNVAWFRPFGCHATVFRGKDIVDHHKLAPRGEPGVFVGLGVSH